MNNGRIGTLYINGEDAVYFAKSLFHPTAEKIARHNQMIEQLNSKISIEDYQGGFHAEVDGLDLSFLDEKKVEKVNLQKIN